MPRPAPLRERGFSLVEVLVAALILGIIALGLVPLYTRSIRSNFEGFDSTQVSNFARSRAEAYLQFPFNSAALMVPSGKTELSVPDYYSATDRKWLDTLASGDTALFTRTTTVRQFSINDVTTPLNGDVDPGQIHIKEITVTVQDSRGSGSLGTPKAIAVRVFKSQ
jgi:prepilin-type N-terminal cleavage/methylation domain-containing protein